MRNHENELGWRQEIGVKILLVLAGLLTLLLISGIACDNAEPDSVSPTPLTNTPALQNTSIAEPTSTSTRTPVSQPEATSDPAAEPTATSTRTPVSQPEATSDPAAEPTATSTSTPVSQSEATLEPTAELIATSTSTPVSQPEATSEPVVEPIATSISTPTPQPTATVEPERHERLASDATEEELAVLARGNTAFALDLYRALGVVEGNLFYSPYSISLALAMAYAGARGETERQMADTLHFSLPQDRLHPAFNNLDLRLASQGGDEEGFKLNIANALWGQSDYEFLEPFLDIIERYYGAGIRQMDFNAAPEAARRTINDWVADQTEGKIKDLIPNGGIDPATGMLLTNAIYFDAAWLYLFSEDRTEPRPFHLLDGSKVEVPTMTLVEHGIGYTSDLGYKAVELPYSGSDMSMIVVLPNEGQFRDFENSMHSSLLRQIREDIRSEYVQLEMPKFRLEAQFRLATTLGNMGMPNAFDVEHANFSGVNGKSCPPVADECILISDILHKAFVEVDESGTEAAAATAVIFERALEAAAEPPRPIEVRVDRPFIFLILDRSTNTVLFVGRIEELEGKSP